MFAILGRHHHEIGQHHVRVHFDAEAERVSSELRVPVVTGLVDAGDERRDEMSAGEKVLKEGSRSVSSDGLSQPEASVEHPNPAPDICQQHVVMVLLGNLPRSGMPLKED